MIQFYFFLCALIIFIAWNWLVITRTGKIDHGVQQAIRTGVWAALAVFLQHDWRDKIMYFVAYHFAFGLPFDIILNKLLGNKALYIGNTAWSDNLGRKWPGAFWGLKFILFLIGMGTLIFGTYW